MRWFNEYGAVAAGSNEANELDAIVDTARLRAALEACEDAVEVRALGAWIAATIETEASAVIIVRAMDMRRAKLDEAKHDSVWAKRREVANLLRSAENAESDADCEYDAWRASGEAMSYDFECADAHKRYTWDAYWVAKGDLTKMEGRNA